MRLRMWKCCDMRVESYCPGDGGLQMKSAIRALPAREGPLSTTQARLAISMAIRKAELHKGAPMTPAKTSKMLG